MRLRVHREIEFDETERLLQGYHLCGCSSCKRDIEIIKARIKAKAKINANPKKSQGVLILEAEPQARTIMTTDNMGYRRINFPYLVFVINYTKIDDQYIYHGLNGSGLRVFLKQTSFKNLSDKIVYSPTDYNRRGVVCTPHEHDEKKFKSLEELANFVVALWWGTTQHFEYLNAYSGTSWSQLSMQEVMDPKNWTSGKVWINAGTIFDACSHYDTSGIKCLFNKESIELIDESWPPKNDKLLLAKEEIKKIEKIPPLSKSAELIQNSIKKIIKVLQWKKKNLKK